MASSAGASRVMFQFHFEAQQEYDSAFDGDAERLFEAAVRFERQVELALERIATGADSFAVVTPGYRAAPVRDFPFQIVYRIEESQIFIAAVAHSSRRADYWARRED